MSFRSRNTFTVAFGLCMEAVGWESRLHTELPASGWCVTLSVDSGWDGVNGMVTLGHVQVERWWHQAPGFAVLVSSVCPFCSRWSCGIWAQTWHFRSRLLLQWGALSPEPQFAVWGQDWASQLRREGERKKKEKNQLLVNFLVSEKTFGFAELLSFCSFTAVPWRDDCEWLGLSVTESSPSGAADVSAEGRWKNVWKSGGWALLPGRGCSAPWAPALPGDERGTGNRTHQAPGTGTWAATREGQTCIQVKLGIFKLPGLCEILVWEQAGAISRFVFGSSQGPGDIVRVGRGHCVSLLWEGLSWRFHSLTPSPGKILKQLNISTGNCWKDM